MRLSSGEDGHRAPQDISEWEAVGRINAVLDRVRSSAPGPGLEEVERLLAKEWLAEFAWTFRKKAWWRSLRPSLRATCSVSGRRRTGLPRVHPLATSLGTITAHDGCAESGEA